MAPPQSALARAAAACFATEARTSATIAVIVLVLGLSIGFSAPQDSSIPNATWRTASSVIGWTYWAAWTVSFWPQVIQNYQRKSVVGLSFDFLGYNLIGFSCYSVYNCAYFWNATVRAQYAAVNDGSTPGVQSNDVFFGLHAIFATLVTIGQCFVYERGGQRVSTTAWLAYAAMLTAIAVYALVVATAPAGAAGTQAGGARSWLFFCSFVAYIKLAISLTKYIPQALLNWRRKSTAGWNIHNVLLDFVGGSLSVVQLLGDGAFKGWSVVIGDPVKFGLGFASMFFDVIFMTQHYCLYPHTRHGAGEAAASSEEDEPLAGRGGRDLESQALLRAAQEDVDAGDVHSSLSDPRSLASGAAAAAVKAGRG